MLVELVGISFTYGDLDSGICGWLCIKMNIFSKKRSDTVVLIKDANM